MLKFDESVKAEAGNAAVKVHGDGLGFRIDGLYHADVSIIDAGAALRAGGVLPQDVIIVLDLHHPVALAKDGVTKELFLLLLAGRIQHSL